MKRVRGGCQPPEGAGRARTDDGDEDHDAQEHGDGGHEVHVAVLPWQAAVARGVAAQPALFVQPGLQLRPSGQQQASI